MVTLVSDAQIAEAWARGTWSAPSSYTAVNDKETFVVVEDKQPVIIMLNHLGQLVTIKKDRCSRRDGAYSCEGSVRIAACRPTSTREKFVLKEIAPLVYTP